MVTARTRERRRKTVEQPSIKTAALSGWCVCHGEEHHKACPIVTGNNTCSCKCHAGGKAAHKKNEQKSTKPNRRRRKK